MHLLCMTHTCLYTVAPEVIEKTFVPRSQFSHLEIQNRKFVYFYLLKVIAEGQQWLLE